MKNITMGFLYEPFQKFRTWIDDEKYVIPLFRGKSQSDEFAERIEKEIDKVMEKEKFCYKDGKTLIPMEYVVFISTKDSNEWYGIKRDFLRQRLEKYVEIRLQMLSLEMFNKNIVHLQSTGEVKNGEIKVVHRWAESDLPVEIWFSKNLPFSLGLDGISDDPLEGRIQEIKREDVECETVVKSGSKRFFCLEICHELNRHTVPVFQPQITLGRSPAADILLDGDLGISRQHLVLKREVGEAFNITATGRNPILIRNMNLFQGQTTNCSIGDTIEMGSYSLKLQD